MPQTREQFFTVLDKVKADGRYIPLSMSGSESWVASELGYQNIGPNYWKGEDGRLALINGQEHLDDSQYVKVFEELARWRAYLGEGGELRDYGTSNELFTSGKAALYVAVRGKLHHLPIKSILALCALLSRSKGMAVSLLTIPTSVWG